MDKNKQPGISFDSIMLVKEEFWRDLDVPANSTPDLQIQMEWGKQDDNYIVELNSILNLQHEEIDKLKLSCTFVGVFSVIEDCENMNIVDFIKDNSAAIMFPYIREHISTVTQKAGVMPILLPPINVIALLNKSDNL